MENLQTPFNYQEFTELNMKRAKDAFEFDRRDFKYFVIALTEEIGEVAGVLKKLERGFNDRELHKMKEKYLDMYAKGLVEEVPSKDELEAQWLFNKKKQLGEELADVFTYLNLFASKANIDLLAEVEKKFNKVSEEMNLPKEYFLTKNP